MTDTPPTEVSAQLEALCAALDDEIPPRLVDRNLLIATWNIRAFGGLTESWRADDDDSPKRDLLGLRAIAEVLSRFDVIALQEVRGNLKALRHTLRWLNRDGDHWGLILTDVTRGSAGNNERMAFVFDTRRVKPSGLACELVVPDRREITDDAFDRQFARTPYAVSFLGGATTFILVTLHVLYGEKPEDRMGELTAIAEWLAEWAEDVHSWDHNLIALGDFNIDRIGDPLYKAFTSTGLTTPRELDEVPRTIFADGTDHHYDQIAWFTGGSGTPALSLVYTGRAGGFDFTPYVHHDLTRQQQSWRVSDHYPLWVEFDARSSVLQPSG
ncbi:MAG: endonuclease/exonuclease/phosphatase family protein [Nitriliruptorales bacterium]|nr:endonuclease/exonuclease/phosphatase family protein [Nitriliruptorales bacterium]